jgi:hypothetical protein
VVWLSADGTWNRAIFSAYVSDGGKLVPCPGGACSGQEKFCDYEHFQWCSRGNSCLENAVGSWHGKPLVPMSIIDDSDDRYARHLEALADQYLNGNN